MSKNEKKFNQLFNKGLLIEARELLEEWLVENPNNVWILIQIAHIYWNMKDYDKAFSYSSRALALDHIEPLTLWYHSLILESLGFVNQAYNIWEFLLQRPAHIIGEIDCGEGINWARNLQVDCLYKMATLTLTLGEYEESSTYVRMLKNRLRKGAESIYSTEDISTLSDNLKKIKNK